MLKRFSVELMSVVFVVSLSSIVFAQAPPGTDIYLVSLEETDAGGVMTGRPRNITSRPGYDNQPSFRQDGKAILYTCALGDGQTDIYAFDLFTNKSEPLTRTLESEYSPTPTPDGQHFSVIRVELDTSLVQRLWQFPFSGEEPSLLIKNINPVGYHAWADAKRLILFVLGQPPTLQIAQVKKGSAKAKTIVSNGGRSLHKIPGREAFSFVHKVSDDEWWIKSVEAKSLKIEPLVKTLPKSEDYAWTPNGKIIMGQGSKLYYCDPNESDGFTEIADFERGGLKNISRLAVSPNGDLIAIVAAE